MTKPIIVVKVPCKLLYVIQVKEFLIKCLRCFCLAYHFFLLENIMKKLLEKLLKIRILTTT